MKRAALLASLARWRVQEEHRYRVWRRYQRTLGVSDPKRAKWHALYVVAVTNVRSRLHELAKLPVSLDAAGIAFIFDREGVEPYAYEDTRGFCTCDVGHLIRQGACTPADYRKYGTKAHPHPRSDAVAFFLRDVRPYEAAVREVFHGAKLDPLPNRFNACVSFALNIGIAGFKTSTTAKLIKAGDALGAANAMLKWDKPPEIQGRRSLESQLFKKG